MKDESISRPFSAPAKNAKLGLGNGHSEWEPHEPTEGPIDPPRRITL